LLLQVQATDLDNDGVNTFFFDLKFTDDKGAQYFSINQNTGEIRIIKALDRDFPNGLAEFKFTVEVADMPPGQNPLIGYGDVTVRPIDVNDNAPLFLEEYMQLSVLEEQDPSKYWSHTSVKVCSSVDNCKIITNYNTTQIL